MNCLKHLLLFLLLQFTIVCFCQKAGDYSSAAPVLKRMIELHHCNPKVVGPDAEKDLLRDFINHLDEEHLFFTAADVRLLQDKLPDLHDGLSGKSHKFLLAVGPLFQKRLKQADSTIVSTLQKPMEFKSPGQVQFANDSSDFATDDADLRNRWGRWLKYRMLYRLSNLLLADSTATSESILKQVPAQQVVVQKTERRKISRVLEHHWGFQNFMGYIFCNTLANLYDPHTEFFPMADKENFVGEVSGEKYSFGVQIMENDKDEIEITHILPGSPAWKCGDLAAKDVLVQMQWEGKPVVDLSGADEEEVSMLLGETNHNRLSLTVRKSSGLLKTVTMVKEKLHAEENFVRSFLLNGEKRIGYVLLPGFYTDWETAGGSSCANDVAREILNLQKENIDGLILDLRNNGGGSMEEALQLSGIFIDEGVLGFQKDKTGKVQSLKDPNRGTVYDGPMVVMINGFSASASEMVAATLQDYNRAIIVGNPSFGKATMQEVLPLDTNLNMQTARPEVYNKGNYDFAKITVGKLYRVSGGSNQLRGVQPDVNLPDVIAEIGYREVNVRYALAFDTVKRATVFHQLPPLPVRMLAAKSAARVSGDKIFTALKTALPSLKDLYNTTGAPLPLQFDTYVREKKQMRDRWLEMGKLMEKQPNEVYKVENHAADKLRQAAEIGR